jgi:hypothetical protein
MNDRKQLLKSKTNYYAELRSGRDQWESICRSFGVGSDPEITETVVFTLFLAYPDMHKHPTSWFQWARYRIIALKRSYMMVWDNLNKAYHCPDDTQPTFTSFIGGKNGKLYVEQDKLETFYLKLWRNMQDHPNHAYSLIPQKSEVWKLIIDIDVKLTYPYECLSNLIDARKQTEEVIDFLTLMFDNRSNDLKMSWSKTPLRSRVIDIKSPKQTLFDSSHEDNNRVKQLNTSHSTLGFQWKEGHRIYTNIIVNQQTANMIFYLIKEHFINIDIKLPYWTLDVASFQQGVGIRLDGHWKVQRCCQTGRVQVRSFLQWCDLCQGSNRTLTGANYPIPSVYEEWRNHSIHPTPADDIQPWTVMDGIHLKNGLINQHVKQKWLSYSSQFISVKNGERQTKRQCVDGYTLDDKESYDLRSLISNLSIYVTNITKIYKQPNNFLFFSTSDRDCPFAQRVHRKNTLYIVANPYTKNLSLRCHDPEGPCEHGIIYLNPSTQLKMKIWPSIMASMPNPQNSGFNTSHMHAVGYISMNLDL